ncbi:MAG TPA: ABC transporter ATP-binding protein [Anaerolineae bacterium]|nr:ABC transporter ATP-binding protein [Anaerolineae bacterium]HID84202.1 ABC transporter ATP-binding protein [Anaerolineales bacterium]HIQ08284.1 ABC transporter ATP-binding protein [Anaerolineaceae bacterium]
MLEALTLGKQFDGFWAVQEVTLQVRPGEIVVLLGPNGAGKTTTMRMLAAILRPSRGRAWVAGYDVVETPEAVRARVGFLTEHHGLYGRMTGEEYLRFFGRLYGLEAGPLQRGVEYWLRYFGLWEARQRRIAGYSKGMRQKLALARALLHEPQVLLLDEPTSAMDPESAARVREAILRLRSEKRTLLVSTHHLAEAEMLADRIAILRAGRLADVGTLDELRERWLGPPVFEVEVGRPFQGEVRLPPEAALVQVKERRLWYRTAAWQRVNPAVVQALVAQGYPVLRLEEKPRTLEQVYLAVMQAATQG